jgi:N-acetylmuramic acid 6-phosphate etherase
MSHVTRHKLDKLPSGAIVGLLLDAEERVVPAVRAAVDQIADAAEMLAQCLGGGGRLAFIGAGTSGRLAVVEAAELPGTFGLLPSDVLARVAGGGGESLAGTDRDEDDVEAAIRDLDSMQLGAGDVLVAVAASGRTPYTVAAARAAVTRGVRVVAVVNAIESPLAAMSDVAIEVPVGPEVLRGSTRLTAGTAQKLVLNALTTTAMVRLGRVHDDVMVDVVAANEKLRGRVIDIVVEIAGCSPDAGVAALVACEWNARAAVLHLTCGLPAAQAREQAAAHLTLRDAIDAHQG